MGTVETYAEALFSVAIDRGIIEETQFQLQEISNLVKTMKDFCIFINHPVISKDVKKDVMKAVFSGKISREVQNFIFIMIDRDKINLLSEILEEYNNLYKKFKNERYVKVYTVVPLYEDEKSILKKKLDTMFNTNAVIENIIDKTIIGGMIIRMGFQVIDGSVRSDLNKIKTSILQGEYIWF